MRILFAFALTLLLATCKPSINPANLTVAGLEKPVEVLRDSNGVNHIYAQSEHDLFFAQGYCAVRDRLFQFEMWRRQATGTVAEILGPRELKRDIGARLFKFRGDLEKEFSHYHPRGKQIIEAFVDGVNAYIRQTEENPELLTPEFQLLGIKPGYWTPEVVISRHQGLLENLHDELDYGRLVSLIGTEKMLDLMVFEPGTPLLALDASIQTDGLFENILELYDAYRKPVEFQKEDLAYQTMVQPVTSFASEEDYRLRDASLGSNNWLVASAKSESGYPLLANDPHRRVAVPSLRYMVHLNAPGWNVVGGGEPTIPGVSIGHNESGAWGLTVFEIDSEDLLVYQINPSNPDQYRYRSQWENMIVLSDTISIKGQPDTVVHHRYTRHGPVTFIDKKRNIAYAARCAWLEPGGAPYLASLRMDVASSWEEFRQACTYNHIPGENMIWADKQGNIGWQASGISAIRENWSGLVPVPGDGRYEWNGFLPITSLPSVINPSAGYWVTANACLLPNDFPHRNAVGYEWSDSSRTVRIQEALAASQKHNLNSMARLQVDYTSLPARKLIPMLKNIKIDNTELSEVRDLLLNWDQELDQNSVVAGIYVAWERMLTKNAYQLMVLEKAKPYLSSVWLKKVIQWIETDRPELKGRDSFLITSLQQAVDQLKKQLGENKEAWKYGQERYHHVLIKHPLSPILPDSLQEKFNCGPLPRGGSAFTVGMTSGNNNQTSGATFRMVADVADWDKTLFTNSPGQSGDVNSPYYKNLFTDWAIDQFFTVYFTKTMIEKAAHERLLLIP